MNEELPVLEMLAQGKISIEEANQLLEAIARRTSAATPNQPLVNVANTAPTSAEPHAAEAMQALGEA